MIKYQYRNGINDQKIRFHLPFRGCCEFFSTSKMVQNALEHQQTQNYLLLLKGAKFTLLWSHTG